MDQDFKLFDAEYKLAEIVWEHEPMHSAQLARLCEEQLNWKRTTTYTVLKKLCNKGILQNNEATVTALVKKEQVQHYESNEFLGKLFNNSLPQFIAAFMGEKKLTKNQAEELKQMIDRYEEDV